MFSNRSAPTNSVLPHLAYADVAEAAVWLQRTFGFTENYRYGEPADGIQMHLGEAWIMLMTERPGRATPAHCGAVTQMLTIFVEDVTAHHAHTREAGARITEDLNDTPYGERQYRVEDLAGHAWLFSQHVRDVSPKEWGAVAARR